MVTPQMYRNVVGDLIFMKKARQSGEIVVQRMFVQAGSNECEALKDKTAATHFECYRRPFAYPMSIMESGILDEIFVWDGALHSFCDRLHRQYMVACLTHSKPMLTSSLVTACSMILHTGM